MSSYATVSDDDFPIVRVVFTGQKPSEASFEQYLQEVTDQYASGEPLVVIFDGREAIVPGLSYQRRQARWLKEHENMMKNQCRGTAYVISNPAVRTFLKGIFAIQPQPVPSKVFSTMEEAEAWVKGLLQSA